jgi:tetratricopeptide (TPR) repeat protein
MVAAPAAVEVLLAKAIAADPDSAPLRLKRAHLNLDRYRFADAVGDLERALSLDATLPRVRPLLGRCYNALGRHPETIAVLAPLADPDFERARALLALDRLAEAEREFGLILSADPHHRPACRHLCKMLRRAGRIDELLETCERLAARGATHAQLFYIWSTALVLTGQDERAASLLLDRQRIAELELPLPDGFADHAEFNAALAEELLGNPYRLSGFPTEDEANRGSSRVHALFAGKRPELIQALLDSLQRLVEAWSPPRYDGFDPWSDARPTSARLKAWGLIQRGDEYEEWHLHPGGWLSGVYYVRVPRRASAEGEGPGCIEFGPPSALQRARPGYVPIWRHCPREGRLLLSPSHYAHRTIPSGLDEFRISFAFDVVPQRVSAGADG